MTRKSLRHYASPAIGLGVISAALAGLLGLHATSQTSVKREAATSRPIPVAETEALGGRFHLWYRFVQNDPNFPGSCAVVPSSVDDTRERIALSEAQTNRECIRFNMAARKLGVDDESAENPASTSTGKSREEDMKIFCETTLTPEQKAIAISRRTIRACNPDLPLHHDYGVQTFPEYVAQKSGSTKSKAPTGDELTASENSEAEGATGSSEMSEEELKVSYKMRNECNKLLWSTGMEEELVDGVPTKYIRQPEGIVYSLKDDALFRYGMCALPFRLKKLVEVYGYNEADDTYYFPVIKTFERMLNGPLPSFPFYFVEGTKGSFTGIQYELSSRGRKFSMNARTDKYIFPKVSSLYDLQVGITKLKGNCRIWNEFKLVVGIFKTPDLTRDGQSTCLLWSDSTFFDDVGDLAAHDSLLGSNLAKFDNISGEITDYRCIFVHKKYFEIVLTKFKASLKLLQEPGLFDEAYMRKDKEIVETMEAAADEIGRK